MIVGPEAYSTGKNQLAEPMVAYICAIPNIRSVDNSLALAYWLGIRENVVLSDIKRQHFRY